MDLLEKYLGEVKTRTTRGPSGIGKKEFQKQCKSCKKFYKPQMKDDDDTCPKCARY